VAYTLLASLSRMNHRLWTISVLYTFIPALSEACSVCFDPNDEARVAFIITTVLLTCVPLIALWTIYRWLRNCVQASDLEQQENMSNEPTLPPFNLS
jgi:hypothetical protein